MKAIKKGQQGFTLIELMIVVAIIGILASIAIPAYQDYMVRTKWGKALSNLSAMKLSIAECLNDNAGSTANCDTVGATGKLAKYGITAEPTDPEVTFKLQTATATIKMTGGSGLGGCVMDLTPTVSTTAGNITWQASAVSSSIASVTVAKCASFIKGAK